MITLSVERYVAARKQKPTGSHYWRFRARGKTVGKGRPPSLDWTLETDGPFPKASARALEAARERFGTTADVVVEVIP